MSGDCGAQKQISICCAIGPWLSYLKVSKLPQSITFNFSFRKGDHNSTQNKFYYDLYSVYFAKSIFEYVA